mgnify:CR=1 FL=1
MDEVVASGAESDEIVEVCPSAFGPPDDVVDFVVGRVLSGDKEGDADIAAADRRGASQRDAACGESKGEFQKVPALHHISSSVCVLRSTEFRRTGMNAG